MARGPNSFLEWVVGRNLPKNSRVPRGPRRIARIDWSADEDSGEDTVALTVPRQRPPRPKKVRFEETEPCKSALKEAPSAAATEVSISESSDATTDTDTTGDATGTEEGSDSDCHCSKCNTERKKQAKIDEAIHAKHKQQKAKKARVTSHEKKNTTMDDSETAVESDSDKPKEHKAKRKKKSKHKKAAHKAIAARDAKKSPNHTLDDTETSDETEASDAADKLEKKGKRREEREKRKAKDKKAKLPPGHPPSGIRQPDLLLPVSSSVLQIEHAVEAAGDPKPNAFYDPVNGVMRMYHGPAYANPYGRLYPQRSYNHQPLPVGVPHPTNNPWYHGLANGQAQHTAAAPQMVQAPQGPPVNPPVTPAPPAPAPPGTHPWFQGHGTVVVGGGDGNISPSARAAERKKTKAAAVNLGTHCNPPAPPNKPSSNGGNTSAGSKSRKDTQTLWQDIHHNPSDGADVRGNGTWGAHDSKGINDFLERLSAKYSNSPKSNKSKSPDKEGGLQRAGFSGWAGGGDQNGHGSWNNDNNDANNQWGNIGNQTSNWNNGNNSHNNNDANNQWGNGNGNKTPNYSQDGHTNANAGDWATPNSFSSGNASNGNWNGGAGSQTASNQRNTREQAVNNWGDSGSKKGDNGNNNYDNRGGRSNTGQASMPWENTTMDQANNLTGGGWGGSIKNGSENGSHRSAKSNMQQETNNVGPPGSWPDDNKQAQASPRGSSSGAQLPSAGGNVVGAFDDWGDASQNNRGGAGWQDPQAAQSTNYWDNEGKGTEKDTTAPPMGGKSSWW